MRDRVGYNVYILYSVAPIMCQHFVKTCLAKEKGSYHGTIIYQVTNNVYALKYRIIFTFYLPLSLNRIRTSWAAEYQDRKYYTWRMTHP